MWGIGNLAGEPNGRDLVLKAGALPVICEVVRHGMVLDLLRHATWAISNLMRGKPPSKYELVRDALKVLPLLIYNDDAEVIQDTCWAYTPRACPVYAGA